LEVKFLEELEVKSLDYLEVQSLEHQAKHLECQVKPVPTRSSP